MSLHQTLVIGVGNAWRRDDGAGPAVAETLAAIPGARCRVLVGEGTELIEAWSGEGRVIVIDAMRSGAPAGTLTHFDAAAAALPAAAFCSLSHRFGLAEAIEMARVLGRLPERLEVWGVEAGDLGQGPGLTPAVAAAVATLVDRLAGSLGLPGDDR